jgi:hypothetical protein
VAHSVGEATREPLPWARLQSRICGERCRSPRVEPLRRLAREPISGSATVVAGRLETGVLRDCSSGHVWLATTDRYLRHIAPRERVEAMRARSDPAHDNGTMLVNANGGGGKTFAVNVILARCLAHGMTGYVLDRAGHYAFLCSLIPGARHLTIGGSQEEHAVNPWDVADPAGPPAEKVTYLVGLHALLVGDYR